MYYNEYAQGVLSERFAVKQAGASGGRSTGNKSREE